MSFIRSSPTRFPACDSVRGMKVTCMMLTATLFPLCTRVYIYIWGENEVKIGSMERYVFGEARVDFRDAYSPGVECRH